MRTPSGSSSAALPTPESCSSCGVLIAPPHSTTSPAIARFGEEPRPCVYSTPIALVPSNSTFVTNARVWMSRLGRELTGCR